MHCCLVFSKARVTPLKIVTIPRTELIAAHLSVKISKLLVPAFDDIDERYYWTDSKIVLSYLNNDVKRLLICVANRLQQIKDDCTNQAWHHVRSKDNPADYASRGATIEQLASSDWLVGHNLFWKSFLPNCSDADVNISDSDPEVRAHVMAGSIEGTDVSIFDSCYKWFVVLRVVAVCLKFRDALRIKTHRCTGTSFLLILWRKRREPG